MSKVKRRIILWYTALYESNYLLSFDIDLLKRSKKGIFCAQIAVYLGFSMNRRNRGRIVNFSQLWLGGLNGTKIALFPYFWKISLFYFHENPRNSTLFISSRRIVVTLHRNSAKAPCASRGWHALNCSARIALQSNVATDFEQTSMPELYRMAELQTEMWQRKDREETEKRSCQRAYLHRFWLIEQLFQEILHDP